MTLRKYLTHSSYLNKSYFWLDPKAKKQVSQANGMRCLSSCFES